MIVMAKRAAVSEVRAWAKEQGFELGDRGRLPAEVWEAWDDRDGAVPQQRTSPAVPAVSAEDLAAAQERISRLEQQVAELSARLSTVESRAAEPRKRFARSR